MYYPTKFLYIIIIYGFLPKDKNVQMGLLFVVSLLVILILKNTEKKLGTNVSNLLIGIVMLLSILIGVQMNDPDVEGFQDDGSERLIYQTQNNLNALNEAKALIMQKLQKPRILLILITPIMPPMLHVKQLKQQQKLLLL